MTPPRARTFQPLEADEEALIEDSIARVIAGWRVTRPELPVDPIAVIARLARLQALMAPRLEGVFARFGMHSADFAVIATVVRLAGDGVSQRRLASELGLSAGTVSLRVDRLVRRGLADRQADPDDGRGTLISLTDAGRELFEACAPEHLANEKGLLAGLTESERGDLGQLLGKLLYTLEDADPEGGLTAELGLAVDGAPIALERRRAVGLPPLAGLLVRHVDPAGIAAASGIRPGDLLTAADRRPLLSPHDLELAVLRARGRRRAVAVEVTRGVEPLTVRLGTLVP
jgi:DNA-binding MarR family transcriptional regulator